MFIFKFTFVVTCIFLQHKAKVKAQRRDLGLTLNDVTWVEGISLATSDGCEWRLRRYDRSRPNGAYYRRNVPTSEEPYTVERYPLDDTSLWGFLVRENEPPNWKSLISTNFFGFRHDETGATYHKVKVCNDTNMFCTSVLDIYENLRTTRSRIAQSGMNKILKHDCLERLTYVYPRAHSAVYDDALNQCFFYEGRPMDEFSPFDRYQKTTTCTREYVEKDPDIACAQSKILNRIKDSGNSRVTFAMTSEGRVNATVTCEGGFSFVNYGKDETDLLVEINYYCNPQLTSLYINTIFGHYVPKCVEPEGRVDEDGNCPKGQKRQLFREGGDEYMACFNCPPGYHVDDADSEKPTCVRCPKGTYTNEAGTSQCLPCPAELAHQCEWAGLYDLDVSVTSSTTTTTTTTTTQAATTTDYCEYVEHDLNQGPQFRCHDLQPVRNTMYCIPLSLTCDCKNDCQDGSDELDCTDEYATAGQTRCSDGNGCYKTDEDRCDCEYDCVDQSDEEGCDSSNCTSCDDGTFYSEEQTCDCTKDCPDGTDEQNCESDLENNIFRCNDGSCVPSGKCDGIQQCPEGEDEDNCGTSFECYSCRSLVDNANIMDENCLDGTFAPGDQTVLKMCFDYCTLLIRGNYNPKSITFEVLRGCHPLHRDEDKEVEKNRCYDLKQESNVRRLLSNGTYPDTESWQEFEVLTCNTPRCNKHSGYGVKLCRDSGISFLKTSDATYLYPNNLFCYITVFFTIIFMP